MGRAIQATAQRTLKAKATDESSESVWFDEARPELRGPSAPCGPQLMDPRHSSARGTGKDGRRTTRADECRRSTTRRQVDRVLDDNKRRRDRCGRPKTVLENDPPLIPWPTRRSTTRNTTGVHGQTQHLLRPLRRSFLFPCGGTRSGSGDRGSHGAGRPALGCGGPSRGSPRSERARERGAPRFSRGARRWGVWGPSRGPRGGGA